MGTQKARREYLGIISGGAILLAGCLGDDDGDGTGLGGNGGADLDPDEVCDSDFDIDRDEINPRNQLLPEDEIENWGVGSGGGGSGQVTLDEDGDWVDYPYEMRVLSFSSEDFDGDGTNYSMAVAEFEEELPEMQDGRATEMVSWHVDVEDYIAVYVLIDTWAYLVAGPDEELARDLMAEFPELDEECAQAALVDPGQ